MTKKRKESNLKNYIVACILPLAAAIGIGFLALQSGFYLQGASSFEQLYKIEIIFENMKAGIWNPLYTQGWYNGYEIFRYGSPFVYWLIYFFSLLAGADMYVGIPIFYGVLVFVALSGFMKFGVTQHRMTAAFLTGAAFLVLPSTLYVFVTECNFDIAFGLALLPGLFFYLFHFVQDNNRMSIFGFTIGSLLLIAANYILAIVFGIVVFLYLFMRVLTLQKWRYESAIGGNLLLSYMMMGYFLYPALTGGILTRDYAPRSVWALPVSVSVFAMAVLILYMSRRETVAPVLVLVLLLLPIFETIEPVLKLIPAKALQKSYWYLLIATALCMVMLLYWKNLRLIFLILFLGIMVWESVSRIPELQNGDAVLAEKEQVIQDYLLWDAVKATDNRVALIDDTQLGDFPHWYFAQNEVASMYGWAYEDAKTTRNMSYVNEAFSDGCYDYVFDRLFLYGNDVVVILKNLLTEIDSYDAMMASASQIGYNLIAENDLAIVLEASEVTGRYGTVSTYENLAIGEDASPVAYIYPSFGIGRSDYIEDYTVEELKEYKKLFLAGFSYYDKEKAENMLKEISNHGVEVYIDMQHIPINKLTGKNEFMGVYAQFVQFTEEFPVLENDNGNQFKLEFKTRDYDYWNTVYISGCDTVLKETSYDGRKHLTYLGCNKDPNITFMGFNLLYHYLATRNQDLKRFLDESLLFAETTLTDAEVIPLEVIEMPRRLIVRSKADHVNCNIANVDTLRPDRIISMQENMWVVNSGETIFRMEKPDRMEGIFISIIGCVMISLLWIFIYVMFEKGNTNE